MPELKARRIQGAVRLSIPASVAYDLGKFQKGLAAVAERLGHPQCFSGADCTFLMERAFVLDERLKVTPVAEEIFSGDPDGSPARGVSATLPARVSFDLERLQESVARIADRLGCQACCSGFDITFRQELDFIIDQDLNIRAGGGAF
jgi:hypothetical protein